MHPADLARWGDPVAPGERHLGPPAATFDLGGHTGAAVLMWITDLGDGTATRAGREVHAQIAELQGEPPSRFGIADRTTTPSSPRRRPAIRQHSTTLLRRHYDRLYGVCRRLAGNDADALDATQEALIALVRGLPRFDGRSSFATWSYRVATNACLDELRRRRRRPVSCSTSSATRPRAGGTTSRAAVADRLHIDDALAALPLEFRAAVVLRDVCALDYAEIAEVLGVPPGTVRSRIARGRAAVAAHIAGNPKSPDDRQIPRT